MPTSEAARVNRLTPLRFVLAFGVVSMLADFVYEGARAIIGPYLATFGASAALVGFITGAGEPSPWCSGWPPVRCRIAPGGTGHCRSPATPSPSCRYRCSR
ncbi:MAG: hypothetical protein ACR2G2_17105 [Pseudonocardia sp.]